MRTFTHIAQFLVAALVVIALGGLAGWYFFVQKEIDTTRANDAARSFGEAPSFGQSLGSAYQNLLDGFGSATPEQAGGLAPRLWKVSTNPVAGMGFSSTTELFFAERSSGNVLRASPLATRVERLTNTLFPKAQEAHFARDGSVILRSIAEDGSLTTFAATLATTTQTLDGGTPYSLDGVYLPRNIRSVSALSDGRILYTLSDTSGGVIGTSATWKGAGQKRAFASALLEWRVHYLEDGAIVLAQKAADDVPGYAFRLSSAGALTPLLSDLPGLTVLPRANSTALLYGTSGGGTLSLFARTSAAAASVSLPIRTVPEKCVWKPGAELIAYCAVPQSATSPAFLREWYRGTLHTNDSWWLVNVSSGTAEQLYLPASEATLDVFAPTIDPSGAYIAFINGVDLSLWMLRINN